MIRLPKHPTWALKKGGHNNGAKIMKLVEQAVAKDPCQMTVDALLDWLKRARMGEIVGVAVVAVKADGSCTCGVTGKAEHDLNWTVGALHRLAWKIGNPHPPCKE